MRARAYRRVHCLGTLFGQPANRNAKLLIKSERLSSSIASGDFGADGAILSRTCSHGASHFRTDSRNPSCFSHICLDQPSGLAGHPSGIRDQGSANIEIMPNAEARVTVVPKTVRSKRPDVSQQAPLGVGFRLTTAPLEPLSLSGEQIPRLMVMATPSPLAAAKPAPTVAVPRTVTPKAKPGARTARAAVLVAVALVATLSADPKIARPDVW